MSAFRYTATPHVRRHGPCGYGDVESYRPWLRDEFTFRCLYCLFREQWGRVKRIRPRSFPRCFDASGARA